MVFATLGHRIVLFRIEVILLANVNRVSGIDEDVVPKIVQTLGLEDIVSTSIDVLLVVSRDAKIGAI